MTILINILLIYRKKSHTTDATEISYEEKLKSKKKNVFNAHAVRSYDIFDVRGYSNGIREGEYYYL